MRFKLALWVVLGLVGLMPAYGMRVEQRTEMLAQAANADWLTLVDAGRYGESWEAASSRVKAVVTKQQWEKTMMDNRAPLGKLVKRDLTSSTYTKTLPGAPDGEYVVTLYSTEFVHKQSAQETVISVLEKDGSWRVAGYYFK
jgi:hypothetical protein